MNYELGIKNKRVAVIGAGIEGQSSKKWLEKQGALVTILDQKPFGKAQGKDTKDYLKNLEAYDVIVRSPGVKRITLEQALPQGSHNKITSQTKLFFDLCPGRIIGVTGTKGKGTTASLIYEMLKKEGFDAYLGGNIGLPPFEFLDKLTKDSWVVLELSSFQLQDITKSPAWPAGRPHIGVILMITSDHLDYHSDVYEYIDAKRNIIRFQTSNDYAVINRDYPASNESDIETEACVFQVSRERTVDENGSFVKDDIVWIRKKGNDTKVVEIKDILLPGKHNLENVCAAAQAARIAGVSIEHISEVLKEFKGLEHRLELVGEVNGVKYYDDSFSTTPETAIAAIQAFKNPEVLILGGSSKGSDFSELGLVIKKAQNIRAIIGVGIEWVRIKAEILKQVQDDKKIFMVEGVQNMKQIVAAASKIAQPGYVVLLSPACASFDMFTNYKERGEQFKAEVKRLSF